LFLSVLVVVMLQVNRTQGHHHQVAQTQSMTAIGSLLLLSFLLTATCGSSCVTVKPEPHDTDLQKTEGGPGGFNGMSPRPFPNIALR